MQPKKTGMKPKNKTPPCRFYILNECKTENCIFRHDEKMKKEYLKNPHCSNYKKTGSCMFGLKCIFSAFHKNCKLFEINECKKPNCSYYHKPEQKIEVRRQKIFPEMELPATIPIFLPVSSDEFLIEFEKKLKMNMESARPMNNTGSVHVCAICLDKEADHIALPCGHLSYCSICSKMLKDCAICRGSISKMQKIYK